MDFDSWLASLREVLQEQDRPLKLQNGHWEVIDRRELWKALGSRIFDAHLDQFKDCSIEVLKEVDPQFELPAEERYAASIHGKVLKHSSDLRQGMAETLALIGSNGDTLVNCSQHKPEATAVIAIREVFENADWKLWGSLNHLAPTLAEAAPVEFLNSVEKALRQKPCPFDELFAQEGTGVTGRNDMTGLLWALECLSWSEEHFMRVAVILAELSSHDPGGNWANRPANSLTTILLPWYPQTLASIDKRIKSMNAVRADFPDVAWKVLLSLLPKQHQISSGTYKPRWRNILSKDWEPKVTDKEYWEQIIGYAELAVEMACCDLRKLRELIDNLDNLPNLSFDAVLGYLSTYEITGLPEDQRLPIWTSLTELARKHRRFSDAQWAMSDENVSKIEATAKALAPASPEGLYRRLFTNRDFDLFNEKGNWDEQQERLDEKRQQAVQEILKVRGLSGVTSLIDVVESPNKLGFALGGIADNDMDYSLLPAYLDNESIIQRQFIGGFVWRRYLLRGWSWVEGLDRTNWSMTQNCQLLIFLPFDLDTWSRAKEWLGDSENVYWQKAFVNPYQSNSDLLSAIDKLLEVKRPHAAIDCLYYRLHKKMPVECKRIVKALLDAVSLQDTEKGIDIYNITKLIKALQDDTHTDKDDLFRVEWAYLPLLDRHNGVDPKMLQARLSAEPDFFCEVIRLIYRSKKEGNGVEEPDEKNKAIARNAWRLLNEWKRPPGLHDDGSFSSKEFETWLVAVKRQCTESGHLEVAMIKVGEVLMYCPADPQGLWIVQEVASALNARDADEMRSGFCTEVFNSRGAHWVDPTGKPERELTEQWQKKADVVENAGFTRFAAALREVAESYVRLAERIVGEHKVEEQEE